MSAITYPYCNKTYSVRIKLLMRRELAPPQGNRGAEICPEFHATDSQKKKWIEVLLKIRRRIPELRLNPKKPPLSTTADRKAEAQGTTTDGGTAERADDEAGRRHQRKQKPDKPKMQEQHQKEQRDHTIRGQTPGIDYLQAPTRTTRRRREKAQDQKSRPKTPKQATEQTRNGRQ